tara:strand:- start:238 stop:519 length:282 start_codon:yes stop_codon:yes gene_type:complete
MKKYNYFSHRMSAFLRKNKDVEKMFSIDWLHIPRLHPEITNHHFMTRSLFGFYAFYQLVKCFLLNSFVKQQELDVKNISNKINYLFVSHIINA